MGREKVRKPRRARPEYVEFDVDGEPALIAMPPGQHEVSGEVLKNEIVLAVREMRRRGRGSVPIPVVDRNRRR